MTGGATIALHFTELYSKPVEDKDVTFFAASPEREFDPSDHPVIVKESKEYEVSFPKCDGIVDAELKIGDEVVATYDGNADGRFDYDDPGGRRLFHGKIDFIRLSLQVTYDTGVVETFTSQDLLCVYASQVESDNLDAILNALLTFEDHVVSTWLFGSTKMEHRKSSLEFAEVITTGGKKNAAAADGRGERSYKSLEKIIGRMEAVADTYARCSRRIQQYAKHKLVKERRIVSTESVSDISPNDVFWLMQNTHMLAPVLQKTNISYRGRHYIPLHMETDVTTRSQDIYENQVLLAFLDNVIDKTRELNEYLEEGVRKIDKFLAKLHGFGYCSPIVKCKELVRNLLEGLMERLGKVTQTLTVQRARYAGFLSCKKIRLRTRPRCTKIFQETMGYREIFQHIVKWFDIGTLDLHKYSDILQVKSTEKLYEYYCLHRLLSEFRRLGFQRVNSSKPYRYKSCPQQYRNERDISNTFEFRQDGALLTLYYEPVIKIGGSENGINLSRLANTSNYCTPDFVIKVTHGGHDKYIILDAKFASSRSIKAKRLPKTINQYFSYTAPLDPMDQIVMVWTLQGRIDNKTTYYELANFNNRRVFGNCPVNESTSDALKQLSEKFFVVCPELGTWAK